jgi:sterol desaturase/sphingolipid hydroxylase (fatty acid hydroxylase superfamily)
MMSRTTLVNLAHITVTTTLTTLLMAGAIGLVATVPTIAVSAKWVSSLPPAMALILVVVVGDTGYYWTHRAAHSIPLLWRLHRIHHASEELNWMAAARAHPLDQLILHLGWLIPLRLLGANTAWFAVYATFLTLEPLLAHSNINVTIKPLKWLIVTPEFHHWHHTAEPDAINKNFASQLPFLDFLFGTWWLPKNRRIARYGINEPVEENYVSQLLAPGVDAVAFLRRSVMPSPARIPSPPLVPAPLVGAQTEP